MSTRSTLDFLRANPSLLAFGFVMALGSSFGQTFFIGIFGPGIRDEFGLSHTAWGTLYMLGTLGSAALLPFTGKLLDSIALRRYAMAVCALMVLACTITANVGAAAWLVLAVFLLRHAGQGLMSHVSLTSMARYFDVGRGRAIAVAALGFSVGEAILPVLAVFVIALIGWRATYGAAALVVLSSAFGPVAMGLLMDRGFSGASICVMFALICVLGTLGIIAGLRRHRRVEAAAARSR